MINRLYPSVPKNPKCVLHDDILPDGTRVKAGDYVMSVSVKKLFFSI
jgi:long-chain fatty acid omega-monooxygenase